MSEAETPKSCTLILEPGKFLNRFSFIGKGLILGKVAIFFV